MGIHKKKIIILSLVAFDVAAVIFTLFIFSKNNENQTVQAAVAAEAAQKTQIDISLEAIQTPEASQSDKESYSPFDGMVKLGDYLDITVSDEARIEEFPAEINIYDSQHMFLDDETGAQFISNLEDSGWHGHEFESTDIDGLYFIGTKDKSEIITNTKEYVESAQEFMRVSGLFDYFEGEGIDLTEEIQGEGRDCTMFYWLTVGGQKTGGYVRIFVESGNNCTECKMYLLRSAIYKTLPSASLEEALENAYCSLKDDFEALKFVVSSARLEYIDGIPYYDISMTGKEVLTGLMCFAPAVAYDEIISDDTLYEKYIVTLGGRRKD